MIYSVDGVNSTTSFVNTMMEVGKTFSSYKELEEQIKEFGEKEYVTFYKRDSRTLEAASKRASVKRTGNADLKYYEVKFACIHGGRNFKSNSSGQRNKKTFRNGCNAHIALKVTADGSALAIVSSSMKHNHEVSKKLFAHHPRERQLPLELRQEAKKLIEMRVNKMFVKQAIQEKTGKVVTLKDLSNIAAKGKSNEKDNLEKTVHLLQETYDADSRILLDNDETTFKGLMFCTGAMKGYVAAYPELVCVDGTFKLPDIDATVYLILVEDGNGESEIVAVGIICSENKESLQWFFESFKEINPLWKNTKCVMTDKDSNKRDILKTSFPQAKVLVCAFHTLKTFEREITCKKMGITSEQRNVTLDILQKLVMVRNLDDFQSHWAYIESTLPLVVVKHLKKNWKQIKKEWTVSQGFQISNFLNATNNRLEAYNQKLKSVIKKYSTLEDFVTQFFAVLSVVHEEIDHRAAEMSLKRSVISFEPGSTDDCYFTVLTEYAFRLVKEQLDLFQAVVISKSSVDTVYNIMCVSGLLETGSTTCTCIFASSMLLPCRHIFAVRNKNCFPLFDESLYSKRWTRSYYQSHQRIFQNEKEAAILEVPMKSTGKRKSELSTNEKYKRAMIVLKGIANVVSQCDQDEFDKQMLDLMCYKKNLETGCQNQDS